MDWLNMLNSLSPGDGSGGGQSGPSPNIDALMQLFGQIPPGQRGPVQSAVAPGAVPDAVPPQLRGGGPNVVPSQVEPSRLGSLAAMLIAALEAGTKPEPDRIKKENRFQELVGKS